MGIVIKHFDISVKLIGLNLAGSRIPVYRGQPCTMRKCIALDTGYRIGDRNRGQPCTTRKCIALNTGYRFRYHYRCQAATPRECITTNTGYRIGNRYRCQIFQSRTNILGNPLYIVTKDKGIHTRIRKHIKTTITRQSIPVYRGQPCTILKYAPTLPTRES